jgi:hypothetical protein
VCTGEFFLMDFVCSYFFFIHWIFFDSVQKIFAFNFNFLFKFSSFIFVLMPRIDLLCCCGDQFFYLFFKISCWKNKFFSFWLFFLYQEHTKICEMRGLENNATRKYNGKSTTWNKKKHRGPKIFFVVQFLVIKFFLFQRSCNFIYILYLICCFAGGVTK